MAATSDPTQEVLDELLAARRGARRSLMGRRLTAGEKRNLEIFFGNAIAVARVRLHSHVFSREAAFCLDNHVFFPRPFYRADFSIAQPDDPASSSDRDKQDLAWLIHECCHVWQFQAEVRRYRWYKALLEHVEYGPTVYSYDLDEKDCLTDYRFEQQGQILQDYAWLYLQEGRHPGGAQADRYRAVLGCLLPTMDVTSARQARKRTLPAWRRVLARY
jgi:hypothetical protein